MNPAAIIIVFFFVQRRVIGELIVFIPALIWVVVEKSRKRVLILIYSVCIYAIDNIDFSLRLVCELLETCKQTYMYLLPTYYYIGICFLLVSSVEISLKV